MEFIYKSIIAILLALIPLASVGLQKYFSKKQNLLKEFHRHFTIRLSDELFMFFNLLLPFTLVSIHPLFTPLAFSIIFSIIAHRFWGKANIKAKKSYHLFLKNSSKLSNAGYVHLFYTMFQLTLIILFLISPITSNLDYIQSFILFVFFMSIMLFSKHINSKTLKSDIAAGVIGISALIIRYLV